MIISLAHFTRRTNCFASSTLCSMIGTSREASLLRLSSQCNALACRRMSVSSFIRSYCSIAIKIIVLISITLVPTTIIVYACLFLSHHSTASISPLSTNSSYPFYSIPTPVSCVWISPIPSLIYSPHITSLTPHHPFVLTRPLVSSSSNWMMLTMCLMCEVIIIVSSCYFLSFLPRLVIILFLAWILITFACINLSCAIILQPSTTIRWRFLTARSASFLLFSVTTQMSLFTTLMC